MKFLAALSALVLIPVFAVAQDLAVVPPTTDEISAFLHSLNGLKGGSALAVAAIIVQGLMLAFRAPLGSFAGRYRLVIMSALTLVAGWTALRMAGLDGVSALLHSTTLISLQVFAHQVYIQFVVKKNEPANVNTAS